MKRITDLCPCSKRHWFSFSVNYNVIFLYWRKGWCLFFVIRSHVQGHRSCNELMLWGCSTVSDRMIITGPPEWEPGVTRTTEVKWAPSRQTSKFLTFVIILPVSAELWWFSDHDLPEFEVQTELFSSMAHSMTEVTAHPPAAKLHLYTGLSETVPLCLCDNTPVICRQYLAWERALMNHCGLNVSGGSCDP